MNLHLNSVVAQRFLILMVCAGCLMAGCSKPKEARLSGIYSIKEQDGLASRIANYDFRSDGTVVFKDTSTLATKRQDGIFRAEESTREGSGTYTITGKEVTANLVTDLDMAGSRFSGITNQWIFRIEGEDLLDLTGRLTTNDPPKRFRLQK